MTALRGQFGDLLAPGFREIFFNKFDRYPEEYSKIFNVGSSKRRYEDESEISGLGAMAEKEEGESIGYDDPIQGYDKRYTHLTYALGFRVSEELWEDDLYGIMNRMPSALAISARQTVETVAWNILNNGFTDSAAHRGPDAEPLFGDATTKDHPLTGGGTEANQATTAADLSVTSLEALIQLMEETVDDRGLKLMIKPKLLVVHNNDQWAARELLDSTDKPYTANNEINPLRDVGLKYFVGHYLTDTDAFFLTAEEHYMNFIWRRKSRFSNDDDFDSGDAKFKGDMRFSVGYTGWRGICGNPGA